MANNKGIIIVKKPPHMLGSIEVTFHDPNDLPYFNNTANQKYASHTVNTPPGKEVGDVVTFDWQGAGPYTANNLRP